MRQLYLLLLLCLSASVVSGQSYAFGVKAGPNLCIQQWNGFSRDPLIAWQGDLFLESHSDVTPSSLYLQLGYHIRGSKLRFNRYVNQNNQEVKPQSSKAKFQNIVLTAGAKRRHEFGSGMAYYQFGFRGEYTVDTQLGGYLESYEGTENKLLFGVQVGGGYELPLGEFVSGIFEITINPDFTKQIYLPRQDTGYTDLNGNRIIIQEQSVTNVSIEVSAGFRFLRKITYYD